MNDGSSVLYLRNNRSLGCSSMILYIYVCGKCRTQFMLPMEKSVTFTVTCANEIIPSINRSFLYKATEGRHVRITIYINNNKIKR